MKVLETRSKNIATNLPAEVPYGTQARLSTKCVGGQAGAQGHQVIQENKIRSFSSCLARPNDCFSVGRGDLVASGCSSFEALDKFGNWNFSQRWERGKVSLLLLTFSRPSVVERWYWMAGVEECHEGHEEWHEEHAYVPKRSTSACRHEDTKDDLHMVCSYLIFLDKKSCLSALVARTRCTFRQIVRKRTMMKDIQR